ncbi:histidine phosphatase family protein [Pleurocapsales cyanobacterium LEGE 10410]|nr:histidine phosphatase family protein [Pleurocapsales cyanobacterium LEGE 10410]
MSNLLSSPTSISATSHKPSTQTTTVILVRHARTTYNEQGRYQGSSDASVLTEQGHQAAYSTGLALQQFDFDAIYTSPLTRVRQTTQAIVSALGLKQRKLPTILVEPKLTEICMSDWQGLYYQEVKEKFPAAYRCWQDTPHLFSRDRIFFPVLALFEQARSFWQEILSKHRGQTILITAHGGTNRALISTAIGLDPKHYHSLQQCNCGISCLEFSSNSNFAKLNYLNVTQHLRTSLPKLKAGKTGWRWLLLSNTTTEKLSNYSCLPEFIRQDFIDLILTDNTEESEFIASNLVSENSKTVHFSIQRDCFLASWQQTIITRQQLKPSSVEASLVTGLIIVSDKLLAQILQTTLGLQITLETASYLSVLHYPHANRQSILQGILPIENQMAETVVLNK